MSEDKSREEFEAWMRSEGRGDGFERLRHAHQLHGLEAGDYRSSWTQSDWEAWRASRRTYRASVLEEAAKSIEALLDTYDTGGDASVGMGYLDATRDAAKVLRALAEKEAGQ